MQQLMNELHQLDENNPWNSSGLPWVPPPLGGGVFFLPTNQAFANLFKTLNLTSPENAYLLQLLEHRVRHAAAGAGRRCARRGPARALGTSASVHLDRESFGRPTGAAAVACMPQEPPNNSTAQAQAQELLDEFLKNHVVTGVALPSSRIGPRPLVSRRQAAAPLPSADIIDACSSSAVQPTRGPPLHLLPTVACTGTACSASPAMCAIAPPAVCRPCIA